MHKFDELILRSTSFTLDALETINSKTLNALQTSGSTIHVKNLQMIQLQKTIFAVGMFSIFDAELQGKLSCRNGFEEAKKILRQKDKIELLNRFEDFICAINVLRHGAGKSYDHLISKSSTLKFKLKFLNEDGEVEEEGNVDDIDTLIEVNDKFVLDCANLIEQVSKEIHSYKNY